MVNRRVLCVLAASLLALACRPKFPTCREDSDCADADNHGLLVHCLDGQCQECKASADCGAGKSCQSMRCVAEAPPTPPPAAAPAPTPAAPGPAPAAACTLPVVHFDFNSSELGREAQQTLQQVATCLLQQPSVHVRIEGDCDDRGTEEYNLALGERRASMVEKYLEKLGVHRLGTISYGKDKPVCTDGTEQCRRQNRRAEFDVRR